MIRNNALDFTGPIMKRICEKTPPFRAGNLGLMLLPVGDKGGAYRSKIAASIEKFGALTWK